jgi:1-deoxy-D-xylulose-5-phosphate synthase
VAADGVARPRGTAGGTAQVRPGGTPVLDRVAAPLDLRCLSSEDLDALAGEIRRLLVASVTRTGGHLGPNLGVVELTIALHRVFDSPHDVLVFDTGHQSYVHKLLTGRQDLSRLRKRGGVSGYPSRAESPHDVVENSHASTAISWADGIAHGFRIQGTTGRHVVAVIGDGALTGGMAWEALNNVAAAPDRPLVVVVNDNERSYAPTIGGVADILQGLRTSRRYEDLLDWGKRTLVQRGRAGRLAFDALHAAKAALKDFLAPQSLFSDLGLKYVGPVDGHDLEAVEQALRHAKAFGGAVIVHVITEKGRGYPLAEADQADRFHGIGAMDPVTGAKLGAGGPTWTGVFAEELERLGHEREDVVAITAAMMIPTGLDRFARRFPDRVLDVGIAEQHAATSAAGMALAGSHPVVAVYSTFLNRAFDQVLMDVALHRAGVTFVLDRAGVTGDDGASHNGMWDLSILQVVPGLRLAAPRDGAGLRRALREAVNVDDAPTVVRYPKGSLPADVPAVATVHGIDVLRQAGADGERDGDQQDSDQQDGRADVLLVSVGAMAGRCLEVADRLGEQGLCVTVVDPRWVKPLPPGLVGLAGAHRVVSVVEDSGRVGGVASAVRQLLADAGVDRPVVGFGIDQRFLDHGSRAEVLAECGLTPQDIARRLIEETARRSPEVESDAAERAGLADPAG